MAEISIKPGHRVHIVESPLPTDANYAGDLVYDKITNSLYFYDPDGNQQYLMCKNYWTHGGDTYSVDPADWFRDGGRSEPVVIRPESRPERILDTSVLTQLKKDGFKAEDIIKMRQEGII